MFIERAKNISELESDMVMGAHHRNTRLATERFKYGEVRLTSVVIWDLARHMWCCVRRGSVTLEVGRRGAVPSFVNVFSPKEFSS